MVLLYPKTMFVLRVYQQNILYFCRILGFFCNIVYLQKCIKVILFWYKCNTIRCLLSKSMKFDLLPDNTYPAYGILRTASASDCRICVLSSSHSWCSVSNSEMDISLKILLIV